MIKWLLKRDADARPTAAELLSSSLLPPKLEVEAAFLRFVRLRFASVLRLCVWFCVCVCFVSLSITTLSQDESLA